MRVAVYTRISSDRHGTQTATARQEEAARAFCTARGWTVAVALDDVDRSAWKPKVQRPGFDRLVQLVDDRLVDGVVVWRLDRLVRQPAEFERFWERCEIRGVFLASATEPIDTTTELGIALVRIVVMFAQMESQAKSERIRAKNDEMAKQGQRPPGPRRFGHTHDYRRIIEPEAKLVREAARRIVAGETTTKIAVDWDWRGVVGVEGKPFTARSIAEMVTSARVAGNRIHLGEVVARGCFPAILDTALAAEVREALASRVRGTRHRTLEYLLRGGLVRCGLCGARLSGSSRNGDRRYGCGQRPRGCGLIGIRADIVERIIVDAVFTRLRTRYPSGAPLDANDPNALIHAHDDLRARLRRLSIDFYANDALTRVEYNTARHALFDRCATNQRGDQPRWPPPGHPAGTTIDDLWTNWRQLTDVQRHTVIETELRHVIVHPARRHIQPFDDERIEPVWWHALPRQPPLPRAASATLPPEPYDGDILSLDQAADRLRLAPSTLLRWARRGQLPMHRHPGPGWTIRLQDLIDWEDQQRLPISPG